VFGSVVVGAFQITFRAKINANDVFSFFKNYFWHQHIKTIQNVQTILNFSKKKTKIQIFLGTRPQPRSQTWSSSHLIGSVKGIKNFCSGQRWPELGPTTNHYTFFNIFFYNFNSLRKKDNKRDAPIETIGTSVFPISTCHNLVRHFPVAILGCMNPLSTVDFWVHLWQTFWQREKR
jgi:hypothetical protein